ncbi:hypothetical protein C1Y40_00267 [Mycobacterium talmoniae]|uniref:Uncharacterized protein n=1 Tax=Mycobacterium talmoniae TaxID=1858794 RepID=A0A2S8BS88_9MYCO|nr:hypothetical protein C1Y40_00267 [Mycobacterium talmoniae]
MSSPSASPLGPTARANAVVTGPGPQPTSNAIAPGCRSNHSVGCCQAEISRRDTAWALS